MAGKTCLHCGKPLVFIRVGAGGDFCSREHRAQYRLRRGMDCLAEANKVSTLARRRETPKALFGEAAGAPNGSQRAYLEAAPFGGKAAAVPRIGLLRKGAREAALRQAGIVAEDHTGMEGREMRRQFGMEPFTPGKARFARGRAAGWKTRVPGAGRTRGLREIAVTAASGNALRISASAGFRLSAPLGPKRALRAAGTGLHTAPLAPGVGSRPLAFKQQAMGAPGEARMAFLDVGFPQDTPPRADWLQGCVAEDGKQVRREL